MKKLLLIILAMLPMVVFTACSSDDDESATSLVGTWLGAGEGLIGEITLKSNYQITGITTKDNGEKEEYVGTYSLDAQKLTINWIVSRVYNPITQKWSEYKGDTEEHIYKYTVQGKRLTIIEIEEGKEGTPFYLLKQ